MPFTGAELRFIYNKTDGHCHICHCRVSINNYGYGSGRGAWEVEHSRPRSKGGTNHRNNLLPACVPCNRDKSNFTTRTARGWKGTTRAPFSKEKKATMRSENTTVCGVLGGLLGLAGGPVGSALGAGIGAAIGRSLKVPKA